MHRCYGVIVLQLYYTMWPIVEVNDGAAYYQEWWWGVCCLRRNLISVQFVLNLLSVKSWPSRVLGRLLVAARGKADVWAKKVGQEPLNRIWTRLHSGGRLSHVVLEPEFSFPPWKFCKWRSGLFFLISGSSFGDLRRQRQFWFSENICDNPLLIEEGTACRRTHWILKIQNAILVKLQFLDTDYLSVDHFVATYNSIVRGGIERVHADGRRKLT